MTEPEYNRPNLTLLGAEHVRAYQETDGEVGYLWNGVPTLLLTTTGRKTGQSRTTPLIFGKDGDSFVVIASVGGGPQHPSWFLNLLADPGAEIQVRSDHVHVIARVAEDKERQRLWEMMAAQWPNYDVYQTRTTRRIPLVVLDPR